MNYPTLKDQNNLGIKSATKRKKRYYSSLINKSDNNNRKMILK